MPTNPHTFIRTCECRITDESIPYFLYGIRCSSPAKWIVTINWAEFRMCDHHRQRTIEWLWQTRNTVHTSISLFEKRIETAESHGGRSDAPSELNRPTFAQAKKWLRDFANKFDLDFEKMVYVGHHGYGVIEGVNGGHSAEELRADWPLFWLNLEAYQERRYNDQHRASVTWSYRC